MLWTSLAKWWLTDGGIAIDSSGPAICSLSSAYSSAPGLHEPEPGPETGNGTDKGYEGVEGSLLLITNDHEEPPYLLPLNRV